MSFLPLKVGEPANDLLRLNYLFNKAYSEMYASTPLVTKFARMWHSDSVKIAGPDANIGSNGYFPYGSVFVQGIPNPSLYEFEHYFTLDAGVYDFRVLCATRNNAGIVEWFVDGVSIGTMDLYSVSIALYVQKAITNVTISTDGIHTLSGSIPGKNASSSNFFIYLYKYCLVEA